MDYNYLIETKNEFLNVIINILTPQIYNGLITMYDHSMKVFNHLKNKIENNPKNISIQIVNYFNLKTNNFSKMTVEEIENEYNKIKIDIFKKYIHDIASKNNIEIEGEYLRIKNESKCADIFDSLIKAGFKSYLLFFTFDPKTKTSKFNSEKYYENINIRDFIHRCYIETCTFFLNNPELFIKRNKKTEINEHIKTCIIMSIRKSLPYNDMLNEYLRINYELNENKNDELKKMEQIINNIMNKNKSKYIINEHDDNINNSEKINLKKIKSETIKSETTEGDLYEDIIDNFNLKKKNNITKKNLNTRNKSDNETSDNETSDNETSDNETSDNETSDKETSDKETSNKEKSDNKKSDNEIIDDKVSNNKIIDDNVSNSETSDSESLKNNDMDIKNNAVVLNNKMANGNKLLSGGEEYLNNIKEDTSNIITSVMSLPKRTSRISKIKNTVDKNMEKFYNDLII